MNKALINASKPPSLSRGHIYGCFVLPANMVLLSVGDHTGYTTYKESAVLLWI